MSRSSIPIFIILGVLALVDLKYNQGAALHGLGQLVQGLIPQTATSQH